MTGQYASGRIRGDLCKAAISERAAESADVDVLKRYALPLAEALLDEVAREVIQQALGIRQTSRIGEQLIEGVGFLYFRPIQRPQRNTFRTSTDSHF